MPVQNDDAACSYTQGFPGWIVVLCLSLAAVSCHSALSLQRANVFMPPDVDMMVACVQGLWSGMCPNGVENTECVIT